MQVRWYEFVRKTLGSQEVREIVKEMSLGKDVVSLYLIDYFKGDFTGML